MTHPIADISHYRNLIGRVKPPVRLNGITRADQSALIRGFSEALSSVGGWIDDINFFWNVSVGLRFVIPAGSCVRFAELLGSQPLQLSSDDLARMKALSVNDGIEEITCTLQVTFFHGDAEYCGHISDVRG